MRIRSWVLAGALFGAPALGAQQGPDREFQPPISNPTFAVGRGPRVCIDQAHHNFHTMDERFWAFAELARRDGHRVVAWRGAFTAAGLNACGVLVISNAQPSDAEWSEYTYPTPSAFTSDEVREVETWVRGGGRLLLIADHMPLAGAASTLAAAFGARFTDGFAYEGAGARAKIPAHLLAGNKPTLFSVDSGTLVAHDILNGRTDAERITQVRSFTGQAFQWSADGVQPILKLNARFVSLEPRTAWVFDTLTTRVRAVGGWLQGGTRRVGDGRVAIFGEAAMFSAQIGGANRTKMGMNAPLAEQNAQFVLNVLHWLTGVLDSPAPPPTR
jgi:hypothetical protein